MERRSHLRTLLGLLTSGYGLLVLLGVLPHESLVAGALSLAVGVALLAAGLPGLRVRRGRLVAGAGAIAVAGVLGFNLALRSSLSWPEWAILGYGAALLAAARHLERPLTWPWAQRKPSGSGMAGPPPPAAGAEGDKDAPTDVGTLVGWSFPLLLAPLALFALNGAMSGSSGAAAAPWVARIVVAPTALMLGLIGTPNAVVGDNILVATPRGSLTLDVGLVCAGIYPIILFLGLVAVHAWQQPMARRHLAAIVAAGLAGLWAVNILRLVALVRIGISWGPKALQEAHANLGWVLFALFMIAFWWLVLRRFERPRTTPHPEAA